MEVHMNMIGLLVVLVVILAATVSLVIYVVTWCFGLWHGNHFRSRSENGFVIPKGQDDKTWNSDLHQQMQLDQQWLFSQLLSQNQEDSSSHDWFEPPMDW
jgi:cell division protein YceG involved in septum cleavage